MLSLQTSVRVCVQCTCVCACGPVSIASDKIQTILTQSFHMLAFILNCDAYEIARMRLQRNLF